MHDREVAALEQRCHRGHAWVETEEAVEVDRTVRRARAWHRDGGSATVVRLFTERHDDVEAINRAALEDGDEHLLAGLGCVSRGGDESRGEAQTHERQTAVLEEDASGHHTDSPWWTSASGTRANQGSARRAPAASRRGPAFSGCCPTRGRRASPRSTDRGSRRSCPWRGS